MCSRVYSFISAMERQGYSEEELLAKKYNDLFKISKALGIKTARRLKVRSSSRSMGGHHYPPCLHLSSFLLFPGHSCWWGKALVRRAKELLSKGGEGCQESPYIW